MTEPKSPRVKRGDNDLWRTVLILKKNYGVYAIRN